jgi:Domain of unknown function (DUF3883)
VSDWVSRRGRAAEVAGIRRHIEVSLLTLIDRQQRQIAEFLERDDAGMPGNIAQAESRLEELNRRLEARLEQSDRERHFSLGDLTHLGRASLVPHPAREHFPGMAPDPGIERIAMRVAMDNERAQGWEPEDVSPQDWGFDVLSRNPVTGGTRFIEVKGRSIEGDVVLTPNEHATARRLGQDYWLYVAFHCATKPQLLRVADPARLDWEPVVKVQHFIMRGVVIRDTAVQ